MLCGVQWYNVLQHILQNCDGWDPATRLDMKFFGALVTLSPSFMYFIWLSFNKVYHGSIHLVLLSLKSQVILTTSFSSCLPKSDIMKGKVKKNKIKLGISDTFALSLLVIIQESWRLRPCVPRLSDHAALWPFCVDPIHLPSTLL